MLPVSYVRGCYVQRRVAQNNEPGGRMLRFLDRHFEEVIAGLGLLVMSTMVFAQVVMRYAFSAPMSWSDEIAVYCMVWSVYLSASWAVRERAHIRVLNLIELFPKPLSTWLIYVSDFIWLVFSMFICWQGVILHMSLWERSYHSPVLNIDQKWPYMVVAVGFALMSFRLIQIYVRHFKYGEPLIPDPESSSEFHG
jgi:C4-dicarboxylate transporter DctQ subunit